MTVRFITVWDIYQPGDEETFEAEIEAGLIAGGLARDAAENDNAGATDLQTQITGLDQEVSDIQSQISDLDEAVSAIEGDISGIEETVSGIEGDVSGLSEAVTPVIEHVADSFVDDAAAAAGGVAVGGLYNTEGTVKVRAT